MEFTDCWSWIIKKKVLAWPQHHLDSPARFRFSFGKYTILQIVKLSFEEPKWTAVSTCYPRQVCLTDFNKGSLLLGSFHSCWLKTSVLINFIFSKDPVPNFCFSIITTTPLCKVSVPMIALLDQMLQLRANISGRKLKHRQTSSRILDDWARDGFHWLIKKYPSSRVVPQTLLETHSPALQRRLGVLPKAIWFHTLGKTTGRIFPNFSSKISWVSLVIREACSGILILQCLMHQPETFLKSPAKEICSPQLLCRVCRLPCSPNV